MLHSTESDINITFQRVSEKSLTHEEILANPELSQFHDVVRFLQKRGNRPLFPKKYEKSMENLAFDKAYVLFKENPQLPLNKVIAAIMDKLPNDVPPPLLLKMTQIAIERWDDLSHNLVTEQEEKEELVAI
jgi:hypothetical protein